MTAPLPAAGQTGSLAGTQNSATMGRSCGSAAIQAAAAAAGVVAAKPEAASAPQQQLAAGAASGHRPSRPSSASRVPEMNRSRPPAGKPSDQVGEWLRGGPKAQERPGFHPSYECQGWKPHLEPGNKIIHNPLLHKMDVYARQADGSAERCASNGNTYRNAIHGSVGGIYRAPSRGRRKGVAEFEDLCRVGAPNWNQDYQKALEADRNVFHVKKSDLMAKMNSGKIKGVGKPGTANKGATGGGKPQRPLSAPSGSRGKAAPRPPAKAVPAPAAPKAAAEPSSAAKVAPATPAPAPAPKAAPAPAAAAT